MCLIVLMSLVAMVTWMVQFKVRLSDNVLIEEDRENDWTSAGRATLGYSFWLVQLTPIGNVMLTDGNFSQLTACNHRFVLASTLSHLTNVVLLALMNRNQPAKYVEPLSPDKANGAVLLY